MFAKILSSFLGIIIFSSCVTTEYNVATHKKDFFFYSVEKEINLGRNLAKEVSCQFKLSYAPSYLEKVNRIGKKLVKVCDRREIFYHFYVIDKDEKNAFCLPGGYIYIFKGLIDIANDDELAFAIAHEIGHTVARHHIKKLQALLGTNLLILAAGNVESPQFQEGLSFALTQIMCAYSREDEFTADELAVKYTKKAGFSPKAGITLLEKLYQIHKKEKISGSSFFRTHPYISQRIKHIKKILKIPFSVSDYFSE